MKLIVRISLIFAVVLVLLMGITPAVKADVITINPSKDNTLYEDTLGEVSNGAGEYLFVARDMRGVIKRGAIAFDIAGNIPPGSTIERVTLKMFASRTKTETNQLTRLFKFTNDWGEGTSNAEDQEGQGAGASTNDATWRKRFHDTSSFWINRGGDFSFTPSGNAQVGGQSQFYTWDSTLLMVADVQEWLDVPSKNFGWIIIGPEAMNGTSKRFDSRENGTLENRPALTVEYTPGNTSRIFFGVSPGCADTQNMVTIAVDSTFGGQFYKTLFKHLGLGGNFEVIQDWGTEKTILWLSGETGVNIVLAQLSDTIDDPSPLRQMGGTYDVGGTDCQHPIYVTLSPASGVVNETVTITAVAEGSTLQYRFWVRAGDFRPPSSPGPWMPMGDWDSANSFQFTPDSANVYTLVIHVTSDINDPSFGQGGLVYVVGQ